MKTFTAEEARDIIDQLSHDSLCEYNTDNEGQLIIYTNVYRWNDGTFRDEPDPSW